MDDGSEMSGERLVFGVIMAGGRGTRFWPASTSGMPKQFLELFGGASMLQLAASRMEAVCPRDRIIVVTGSRYEDLVRGQLPWILPGNLMLEPSGRNTAPCIGWAATILRERGFGDGIMAVVASDHRIEPVSGFAETMESAVGTAADGWLVTIGVKPDRPATGYGYIEAGEAIGNGAVRVVRFVEKPDAATAASYAGSGRFYWNSGMFVWRTDRILEEISTHLPGLYSGLERLGGTTSPPSGLYSALESVSVDYGVMEKADRVAMVPAGFEWDDVGDWPGSRRARVGRGEVMSVGSRDCTVWSEDGRLTVLLGVEGISVVQTDRVTLVMDDSMSQDLRDVVRRLEEERPDLV
jgi:mannose-1-phosphate guanylyltransferase